MPTSRKIYQKHYQIRRIVSCMVRAALPEFLVDSSPSCEIPVGLFGLFRTLKKSALIRSAHMFRELVNLNSDESRNH